MSDDELAPGTVVGSYRVERKLGQGGMGAVYVAVHSQLQDKRAAVKVLAPGLAERPDIVTRFRAEAEAASKIGHPNIIAVFDWGQLADGRPYLLMEYLEGESLDRRLARGNVTTFELRRIFKDLCLGLGAAHRAGIVHRDLKPENVYIVRPRFGEPGEMLVKILDFGIAKLLDANQLTRTGAVMGTPYYMAPEQCRGQPVDHRADLYALGVILYQSFTGRLPFAGESMNEVLFQHVMEQPPRPSSFVTIAPPIETLILDCLAKAREARPQSAAEVMQRLDEGLAEGLDGKANESAAVPSPGSDGFAETAVSNLPQPAAAPPRNIAATTPAHTTSLGGTTDAVGFKTTNRRWYLAAAGLAISVAAAIGWQSDKRASGAGTSVPNQDSSVGSLSTNSRALPVAAAARRPLDGGTADALASGEPHKTAAIPRSFKRRSDASDLREVRGAKTEPASAIRPEPMQPPSLPDPLPPAAPALPPERGATAPTESPSRAKLKGLIENIEGAAVK